MRRLTHRARRRRKSSTHAASRRPRHRSARLRRLLLHPAPWLSAAVLSTSRRCAYRTSGAPAQSRVDAEEPPEQCSMISATAMPSEGNQSNGPDSRSRAAQRRRRNHALSRIQRSSWRVPEAGGAPPQSPAGLARDNVAHSCRSHPLTFWKPDILPPSRARFASKKP